MLRLTPTTGCVRGLPIELSIFGERTQILGFTQKCPLEAPRQTVLPKYSLTNSS